MKVNIKTVTYVDNNFPSALKGLYQNLIEEETNDFQQYWSGLIRCDNPEQFRSWFEENITGKYILEYKFNGGELRFYFALENKEDIGLLLLTFGPSELYIDSTIDY